ncbi:nucleotidyltransferase family protein [Marivita sp. S6314]|uniref:nucleotidyltransferase family protein n=1 Tax=Marivita sp. S6314 TaxID=2926406 RepID=UPI001FF3ED85|nr:nucleotidyltransferase family protein [Marivita sp. S6314]MCK0151124.1 nucleotidyltransferase family protein [Marivita sp. S6314]
MTKLAIVIPAAGASQRMGDRDKLLEPVDGAPLLRGVATRARQVSDLVFVTLRHPTDPRADALANVPVHVIDVPDAQTGMSASLRQVSPQVPGDMGVMVLPADMPDLTTDDLHQLVAAFAASGETFLVQATSATGAPGHPVIFPSDLVPAFQTLTGDEGARSVVKAHRSRLMQVSLPGDHAVTDLDTPEDWAAWRARNPKR